MLERKKEKRNELLKRTEYDFIFAHPGKPTPTKEEMREIVAKELGVEKERVDVRKAYSEAGRPATWAKVYVWDNPEDNPSNKKEVVEDGKEEEA